MPKKRAAEPDMDSEPELQDIEAEEDMEQEPGKQQDQEQEEEEEEDGPRVTAQQQAIWDARANTESLARVLTADDEGSYEECGDRSPADYLSSFQGQGANGVKRDLMDVDFAYFRVRRSSLCEFLGPVVMLAAGGLIPDIPSRSFTQLVAGGISIWANINEAQKRDMLAFISAKSVVFAPGKGVCVCVCVRV
jgi:hypothetical protein